MLKKTFMKLLGLEKRDKKIKKLEEEIKKVRREKGFSEEKEEVTEEKKENDPSVIIFNFDKVKRKTIKITFKKIDYDINEPTLGDYAEISKLDFSQENNGSLERLAGILAPTVKIEWLTTETRDLFFTLCFQALRGEFTEEKKWKLEELKKE